MTLGVAFFWMTSVSGAAPIATPIPDCNGSFNPYDYTQAAVAACGYRTYPLRAVTPIAGGGATYDYDLDGHLVREYVPPSGFDGTVATDTQLQQYGLPPRPSDLAAYPDWQSRMADVHVDTPPPFIVESNASADTVKFNNWSGYAVTGSGGTFTHAETWYYQPTFYSSRCTQNSETTWAGIGGYNGGDGLGQDGTAHNVPGFASDQGFWEVWPDNNMVAVAIGANPGYEFDASVRRISGGYRFYMYDYKDNTTRIIDSNIDDYTGNSAEAISERPKVNGQLTNLSNFERWCSTALRRTGVGSTTGPGAALGMASICTTTASPRSSRARAVSAATVTSPTRSSIATDAATMAAV